MTYATSGIPSPSDTHRNPQSIIRNPQFPLWRDRFFWLTLLLTSFAVAPFALPGYFWGANDARHHVYFLFEYNRNVQDGIWWPRWSPDFTFGYGYPFFNIYGLFSHFVAELLLHFLNFSYTGAIETVFCLSIVGSAATMYLFVRDWAGRNAALLSALVYTYIPYHLLNLYVRANLAESMAMLWPPLILWSVRRAVLQRSWWAVLACALSYAGLMLTSNLVMVLVTPLIGLYLLIVWLGEFKSKEAIVDPAIHAQKGHLSQSTARVDTRRNPQSAIRNLQSLFTPVFGLLLGLGLSANFWIPMLLERGDVRVDQWFDGRYDFHPHFVYFQQLFSPTWGFGVSVAGPDDTISFQIGAAALLLAIIGLFVGWRRRPDLRWEITIFAVAALVSVFVSLQIAASLWDLPVIGAILGAAQFPWRWFNVMTICISILAGLVLAEPKFTNHESHITDKESAIRNPNSAIATLLLSALVILISYPYLQVQVREPAEGPVGLASLMRFQRDADELTGSTRWVKEIPHWSPIAEQYIQWETEGKEVTPVTSLIDYGNFDYSKEQCFAANSYSHTVISEEVWFCNHKAEGQALIFNHFYYPGWHAWLLDGEHGQPVRELPIVPAESGVTGRMTVPLPLGEGNLLLRFEDTMPRKVGKLVSLGTVVAMLIVSLFSWWRKKRL